MNRSYRVSVWLASALGLLACGSNSPNSEASPQPARSAAGTGVAGSPSPATSGVAGLPSWDDLMALATPMCDPDAQSVTSCGDTQCPALPAGSEAACAVTCCSPDNQCGIRSTDKRLQAFASQCIATPVADPRCPSQMFAGTVLQGCCDAQGLCGGLLGACLSMPGARACDAPPAATDQDAGL